MATTMPQVTETNSVRDDELAEQVLDDHRTYLFPAESRLYEQPLVLVRGQGVWIDDARGDRYLDYFSGILTNSLGHGHPEVVQRVMEQLHTLGHTSTLYLHENEVAMARRLAQIAPGRLSRTFFTNSGTEAIETAVMLAQIYTGRTDIIALRHSYSGRSTLATNLTAHASWRPLNSSVAIKHVLAPYPYRCPFKRPCDESCVDALANDLEEAIVTTTNGQPAALLAETILGVGGYVVPPPGYFQRVAEIIR